MSWSNPLRRWCDRKAVTVVEFAFMLPGMLMLICGTIEIGHMIFARVVLEGAVTEAARLASASLETAQTARTTAMSTSITEAMRQFPLAPDQVVTVSTTVFRNFSTAYPEPFTDTNRNGVRDGTEPFVDRNQNGVWNAAVPLAGQTLGGPGDVVSFTATFPKRVMFGFIGGKLGLGSGVITLRATTTVRNEAVVRRI